MTSFTKRERELYMEEDDRYDWTTSKHDFGGVLENGLIATIKHHARNMKKFFKSTN